MLPTGLIGVIHLSALPGDPLHCGEGFQGVAKRALEDAEAMARGGVDALVVENFGSAPFVKGTAGARIPAHQAATLALVADRAKERFEIPVGVNCLRNDAYTAIGIAAAAGLDFIRVNVHTGAYVTDQGLIEGEADATLRYRLSLGAADVAIAADVLVKHAAPLAPVEPEVATKDTLLRGLADAVVVSGQATGSPVDEHLLSRVRTAAGTHPVWIGSGLTPDNAASLVPMVNAAVVGTYFKVDGDVRRPVDVERVRALAKAVRGRFA